MKYLFITNFINKFRAEIIPVCKHLQVDPLNVNNYEEIINVNNLGRKTKQFCEIKAVS